MATKSSNKGAKARARGSKGAAKTSTKQGAKRSAQPSAKKGAKKGAKATKATKAAKAKPAAKKATKAPRKIAALIGTTGGTQISDIQIVPYVGTDAEDNIACRPQSSFNLFPDIITKVNVDNDPVDSKFRLTFVLNPLFGILPGTIAGCNSDGLMYLPALSANIASIGGPEYLGPTPIRKIRVKIFPLNPQQVLPFTFAFRLRFTQNPSGVDFPKHFRKRGSIKVR